MLGALQEQQGPVHMVPVNNEESGKRDDQRSGGKESMGPDGPWRGL